MKTHSPLLKTHPHRYPSLCTLLLILAAAQSHAACGNGSVSITNVPHLGGSSYTVSALNALGQVAGYSQLPGDQAEHAFLFGPGGLTDLGTLGGISSYGFALNDSGQVAGDASLPDEFQPPHAFLFDGSSLIDLGTLGGFSSSAVGINNAGQVTGTLQTSGSTTEAFLYENGVMQSLGHLGGFYSWAAAINQSGAVAGRSLTESFDQHAFLYANDTMTDLGSLGGGYSDAFALNDSNVVVGESYLANGDLHGFVFAGGTMSDVGTLGGNYSSARQINNAGQVIGVSTTTAGQQIGFIYSSGIISALGTLGGDSSTPSAINDLGQVVGQSELPDGGVRAFVWQNGVMTDLNTLLPANSGWVLQNAQFINDSGRIVGTGTYNDQPQWFILDMGGNNNPPTAVAQVDQSGACSGTVTLDGTQSGDPDNDALTYEWSENGLILGTNATLTVSLTSGAHTLTLRVADPCGEVSQDTVAITVGDTTPPTISCPGTVASSGRNGCEASVPDLRSRVTVSDNCTPGNNLIITQSPAPGTILGAGQYPITVTVTDAAGNAASCTTMISVGDDQPPVLVRVPKSVTIGVGNDCQTKVPDFTCDVVARDNCTPSNSLVISQTPAAGTQLEKGEHSVLLTVTDGAGNSTTKSVSLRIKDRTAPKIHSVAATPDVLSPANGNKVKVTIAVTATDNCDDTPTSKIVKILCDEQTSRGDIKITGALTAELVATTSPRGNGRIYTIVIASQDDSGNTAYKWVNVHVPKAKKDHPRWK